MSEVYIPDEYYGGYPDTEEELDCGYGFGFCGHPDLKRMGLVNKINVYLEYEGFYVLFHWWSSIKLHLHIASFDKELTVCQFGVWIL